MGDNSDRPDQRIHDRLERLSHRFPGLCARNAEHYLEAGDAIGRSLHMIVKRVIGLRLRLLNRSHRPAPLGDSGSNTAD